MKFEDVLQARAQEKNIAFSLAQLNKFAVYYQMLVETNKQMNLTSLVEPEEVAVKHFIDSLMVYDEKYFAKGTKVCDVGSGAGFPGIPLKIYQPSLQITLLDSLAKRLKFLDSVIVELGLEQIETCHIRAEDAGNDRQLREKYDVVTARAVAPLSVLCEYCLPLVRVGGIFAAMKGRQFEQELAEAKSAVSLLGARIEEVREVRLPGLDDVRAVLYFVKEKRTPAKYPRKAGMPSKNPL